MANKLAAWNERRIARDLYDIWFFLQMNISPDEKILKKRLAEPRYSKLIKKVDYFAGETLPEFYDFVRAKLGELSDQQIVDQLSDYLLPDELEGLVPLIRHGFVQLR